ncbi:MAG: hypothetical protein B6245_03440 [Desulfobacteraceae bacterium 4572_88]|nr:MAG: hypothetical protein B6245_03440 [Desulfobacteraceae bacterium 4572_88]
MNMKGDAWDFAFTWFGLTLIVITTIYLINESGHLYMEFIGWKGMILAVVVECFGLFIAMSGKRTVVANGLAFSVFFITASACCFQSVLPIIEKKDVPGVLQQMRIDVLKQNIKRLDEQMKRAYSKSLSYKEAAKERMETMRELKNEFKFAKKTVMKASVPIFGDIGSGIIFLFGFIRIVIQGASFWTARYIWKEKDMKSIMGGKIK